MTAPLTTRDREYLSLVDELFEAGYSLDQIHEVCNSRTSYSTGSTQQRIQAIYQEMRREVVS